MTLHPTTSSSVLRPEEIALWLTICWDRTKPKSPSNSPEPAVIARPASGPLWNLRLICYSTWMSQSTVCLHIAKKGLICHATWLNQLTICLHTTQKAWSVMIPQWTSQLSVYTLHKRLDLPCCMTKPINHLTYCTKGLICHTTRINQSTVTLHTAQKAWSCHMNELINCLILTQHFHWSSMVALLGNLGNPMIFPLVKYKLFLFKAMSNFHLAAHCLVRLSTRHAPCNQSCCLACHCRLAENSGKSWRPPSWTI